MKMTKDEWLSQYNGKVSERDLTLLRRAYEVLESNIICPDNSPWGRYEVISPWPGENMGIWNWDSAFHAMTVSRYDTLLAKNCINCFMKFQLDSGMLPDVIFARGEIVDNFTKPPVMPWGVLTVYERDNDIEFLRENYMRLVKNEEFWVSRRCDRGLFFYTAESNPEANDYLHPRYESGWDDSPRWDETIIDLWPIDLNCYMVIFYRSMSRMAKYLGLDFAQWDEKESKLAFLIESTLFDDAGGAYADRNRKTGRFSRVLSPASFMPLFINIASAEHAAAMKVLAEREDKFYPGMPTVSYDDPAYSTEYWRGQTWLNVAYFAAKGLLNYGYTSLANEIKEFLLSMVYDNLPYIWENYDTKARRGKFCSNFSWSSAFIIEFILNW